jgi:hypothetical protein
MTTKIIIQAHCSPDKEVVITQRIEHRVETQLITIIQNGEEHSCVVYDNKSVTVCERLK